MKIIQWHITEECNWRCKHCYHDNYLDKGPSLNKLKDIFNDIIEIWICERINFAWWEPFLRKDFLDFLDYIDNKLWLYNKKLKIWILTNGSFIDEKLLINLKKINNINFFFQISIEWTKEINDSIRWIWAFDTILKAMLLLEKFNFYVDFSFTVSKMNEKYLFWLIPFVKKFDMKIKVRRLVPMWQADSTFLFTALEWYNFSKRVKKINFKYFYWKKIGFFLNWCSEITSFDYKWFWCWINQKVILTIMHDLDVYSCRRLPIVLWNLNDNNILEIYNWEEYNKQSESYKEIEICKSCQYYNSCKWWAKCITYAVNNTLYKEDPQCYIAKKLKWNEKKY